MYLKSIIGLILIVIAPMLGNMLFDYFQATFPHDGKLIGLGYFMTCFMSVFGLIAVGMFLQKELMDKLF